VTPLSATAFLIGQETHCVKKSHYIKNIKQISKHLNLQKLGQRKKNCCSR